MKESLLYLVFPFDYDAKEVCFEVCFSFSFEAYPFNELSFNVNSTFGDARYFNDFFFMILLVDWVLNRQLNGVCVSMVDLKGCVLGLID